MANPKATIADAFEKLKRSISEEDAHEFSGTQLKDVWFAVREIDSEQRKRRSAQNIARIKPLLEGIEKYTSVIEVLCNGTPFMPYIWAPIKDVFEALLAAYSDIGSALPRFDRYETAFKGNLEFQNVLASVYCDILDFHQRAYKFFRRRAWHVLFLSTWKDFGNRFDKIIESLKAQRAFVDAEAASIDIVEAKDSRMKAQDYIQQKQRQQEEEIQEKEKKTRIMQIQNSIAWLSVDKHLQEADFERTASRRHDGTCRWIVDKPEMKAWVENDAKCSILWLSAKPGGGKSVMCSYIIQMLMDTPDLTCCYYFVRSSSQENICRHILAIIVLQLIAQHPDICTLIANKYAYSGATSGMTQLRVLVPELLELVPYTRIVIDGIDECSEENQKSVLKELQMACKAKNSVKVLFSSRKEIQIYQRLSTQPKILLDKCQEVDLDIQDFIEYSMAKLRTSDQNLQSKIKQILIKKANGMFLWVRLMIEELRYCYSDAALEEAADALPKGLQEAYGRILERIMSAEKSKYMAIRILEWMACSYRLLKKYEILDGIALDTSNTKLSSKTKIRADVLDLCRPLIEDGPDNTINFVHFSIQEYILEEEFRAQRPFIWRENAHLNMSFSCITCLNSCASLLPINSTDSERACLVVKGFYGLCNYANGYWYKHLLAYCNLDQQLHRMPTELVTQLQLLLQFMKKANYLRGSTPRKGQARDISNISGLQALSSHPDVMEMVMEVLNFRERTTRENYSEKSPETISLELCDTDLTYFSTVRHYYQQTVESLLDENAIGNFPSFESKDLQNFRDVYGATAFLCRYLNCAIDGFQSASQRAKHESQHRQRYRCAHSSCMYATTGFTTANLLKKHIEKYHSVIMECDSLAGMLSSQQNISTSNTIEMYDLDNTPKKDGPSSNFTLTPQLRRQSPSKITMSSALIDFQHQLQVLELKKLETRFLRDGYSFPRREDMPREIPLEVDNWTLLNQWVWANSTEIEIIDQLIEIVPPSRQAFETSTPTQVIPIVQASNLPSSNTNQTSSNSILQSGSLMNESDLQAKKSQAPSGHQVQDYQMKLMCFEALSKFQMRYKIDPNRPFPRHNLPQEVPQGVQTWKQLRSWISQPGCVTENLLEYIKTTTEIPPSLYTGREPMSRQNKGNLPGREQRDHQRTQSIDVIAKRLEVESTSSEAVVQDDVTAVDYQQQLTKNWQHVNQLQAGNGQTQQEGHSNNNLVNFSHVPCGADQQQQPQFLHIPPNACQFMDKVRVPDDVWSDPNISHITNLISHDKNWGDLKYWLVVYRFSNRFSTDTVEQIELMQRRCYTELVEAGLPDRLLPPQSDIDNESALSHKEQSIPTGWSLPAQFIFRDLLGDYGTDWSMIADLMAGKTPEMVENYYLHQVEAGNQELQRIAAIGDAYKAKGTKLDLLPPREELSSPSQTSFGSQLASQHPSNIVTTALSNVENYPTEMNEDGQKYCYCNCNYNSISFGQTIMCQAEGCAKKWFHLRCLGLEPDWKFEQFAWRCIGCKIGDRPRSFGSRCLHPLRRISTEPNLGGVLDSTEDVGLQVPWSLGEDAYLTQLVHTQGTLDWARIAQLIGSRSPKQCRERYHQNLEPSLNHDPIRPGEGLQIVQLVATIGKRWAEIARRLNGRSDSAVKKWYNDNINREQNSTRGRNSEDMSYGSPSDADT